MLTKPKQRLKRHFRNFLSNCVESADINARDVEHCVRYDVLHRADSGRLRIIVHNGTKFVRCAEGGRMLRNTQENGRFGAQRRRRRGEKGRRRKGLLNY